MELTLTLEIIPSAVTHIIKTLIISKAPSTFKTSPTDNIVGVHLWRGCPKVKWERGVRRACWRKRRRSDGPWTAKLQLDVDVDLGFVTRNSGTGGHATEGGETPGDDESSGGGGWSKGCRRWRSQGVEKPGMGWTGSTGLFTETLGRWWRGGDVDGPGVTCRTFRGGCWSGVSAWVWR